MPLPALSLVGLAIAWLAKHFTFEIAKYIAIRALVIGVILNIGPWVIFKGISLLMQFLLNYASSYVGDQEVQPVMIQMTGIAAYLANILQIPQGISIFLSFLSVSFALKIMRVK